MPRRGLDQMSHLERTLFNLLSGLPAGCVFSMVLVPSFLSCHTCWELWWCSWLWVVSTPVSDPNKTYRFIKLNFGGGHNFWSVVDSLSGVSRCMRCTSQPRGKLVTQQLNLIKLETLGLERCLSSLRGSCRGLGFSS